VATFLTEAIGTDVTLAEVAPSALPNVTAALSVGGKERALVSRNVIATLPGSDPELRDEAVILGAHLDHLGRVGAQVYPGADDNASGVAALLEIARIFGTMQSRPRRTLVFAFWTGEEEGKFGSGYWVRHPLWPLASTVTYINIDMIGHPWLIEEIRELVSGVPSDAAEAFLDGIDPADLVEVGLPPGNKVLDGTLRTVALGTGLPLHLDRTDGRNGGSDYRDFARAGVPFLRFFGNFFPGYHEPADTPDRVDPAQVQRVARFCLATALLLADQGSSTSAYQPRETIVVP
jgi:Zn-dependent M28 family amino/carboxypeptidase